MEKNKKIIYIPGWMDRAEYNGFFPGLDIWGSDIDYREFIEADVIVAHSLGCHFALLNWKEHKNAKLILINPVLGRRKISDLFMSWIKFFWHEGMRHANYKRITMFLNFFAKMLFSLKLMQTDVETILFSMPKENVCIVKGGKDEFFWNQQQCQDILDKGINFIEIPNMGHVWNKEDIGLIVKSQV